MTKNVPATEIYALFIEIRDSATYQTACLPYDLDYGDQKNKIIQFLKKAIDGCRNVEVSKL